jgi:hypothetical protein
LNLTATAKAAAPEAPQNGAGSIDPTLPITPVEAWAMVTKLQIGLEWYGGQYIATYRNRERDIYLPVPADSAYGAVVELLSQLGVEVAHG